MLGETDLIRICPDHIQTTASLDNLEATTLMRWSYFKDSLAGLDQFSGFFPRWYLPSTSISKADTPEIAVAETLAIIDTALEIYVGVGYEWPPLVLEQSEI